MLGLRNKPIPEFRPLLQMDATMILLCGFYCVGMAMFHAQFSKLFNWKEELAKMNVANKAIIQIANLRLIYFFLFVAAICFLFPDELTTTPLGRFFMIGMAIFWFSRTIEQLIFLKVNHPMVHLLTYLFLIGAILFLVPVIL
jgi:hypothetical protein